MRRRAVRGPGKKARPSLSRPEPGRLIALNRAAPARQLVSRGSEQWLQPAFSTCAAASVFFALISVRRPSGVLSALSRISAITWLGISFGLTVRIFAARFTTCGEAIDV